MGISRLYAPSLCSDFEHVPTFFQTNVLVGGGGHAYIAGLGTASIIRAMPGEDLDRSFHGAAPELIDPQRLGSTNPGTTMASDVYAFAILAWEVRMEFVASRSQPLNGTIFAVRFSLDDPHSPTRALSRGFIQC